MLFPLTVKNSVATLAGLMAPVPQFIDLPLLIEQRGTISGEFALALMPRLLEITVDDSGSVWFELAFGRDDQGIHCITGQYSVSLQAYCQRCLNPVSLCQSGKICLAVVTDRIRMQELPVHYEPLLHDSGSLSLVMLLEDEILLGLPIAPAHSIAECPSDSLMREYSTVRDTPFTVLKNLKFIK